MNQAPPPPDGHDPYHEPPSKVFTAWARFAVGHRWLMLALSALALGISAWLAVVGTRIDTSVEAFADHESDARKLLDEYRAEFGRDDVQLVLVEGDVFSREYLERLKALHQALAALDLELPDAPALRRAEAPRAPASQAAAPGSDGFGAAEGGDGFGEAAGGDGFGDAGDGFGDGGGEDAFKGAQAGGSVWAGAGVFEEVTSLINVRRTRATAGGIEVGQLFDPLPAAAELPALKAKLLADPFLVGQVLGEGGRHSAIVMRMPTVSSAGSRVVLEAVEAICAEHVAPGFNPIASGLPALDKGLNDLLLGDLAVMLSLSVVAMILILSFLFRHPMGVFAPLSVVGLAAGNAVAFMAALDMPVTILSNVLPAFLFCVGIGDSVHLISVYRDARRFGVDNRTAIVHAVGTTGAPMLFTSITTMVLLPALLTFNTKSLLGAKGHGGEDFIDRFLHGCRDLSGVRGDPGTGPLPAEARRRTRTTLAVGVVLLVTALVGTSQIRVWHNPLTWMPEDAAARQGLEAVDQHIGGTANVQLLIDGTPEKGMKDLALLKGLEALERHIGAYEDAEVGLIVGNSFSLLNVIKETWQALHGGGADQWRLPDTERGVADALFLFSNAGPDELKRLTTLDLSRSQMTIRIRWLEATSYAGLVKHIQDGIDAHIPAGRRVQATGSVYTLVNTIRNLLADLIRSFGTAFIVITLIMMFLLRGLKLGLIAMVPNLMPIVFIMGIMGAFNIPIDISSLLIASISIGIAVDDTIHLLHHWRIQYKRTGNVERAIEMSMQHSGRAMVSTSIILMVGFFTYLGANMHNIQRFGLLVGLTALLALLIDLIFAPALLRLVYKRPKEA